MKLSEVFGILADGVEEEERLREQNASESAINKIWLPVQDVARTPLTLLTQVQAARIRDLERLVA